MMRRSRWSAALLAGVLAGPGAPHGSAAAATAPRFDGLWQGEIVYTVARTEFTVAVELALGADGKLGGTIDIPMQRMEFHPLDRAVVDGRKIEFAFKKVNEKPDGTYGEVEFIFWGELDEAGEAITGEYKGWIIDGKNRAPFRFTRIGEAGDPRAEPTLRPLTVLGPGAGELRAAFNRHPEAARLVLLLSPT